MSINSLPKDIGQKVIELFPADSDRNEMIQLISGIYENDWGVGSDQLVRALLVLSEGKPDKFKAKTKNMEPRDLIMEAEVMLENPGHYFLEPFISF